MTKRLALKDINNDNEHPRREDRLSILPDAILVTILSLLGNDSAAATSVLSRRWRYLWTHITRISFRPRRQPKVIQDFHDVVNLVDGILSQLPSHNNIHTLDLDLSFFSFPDFVPNYEMQLHEARYPVTCITNICRKEPEVLKVRFNGNAEFTRLFCLNTSLFQTQSLVQLEIDSFFEFDFRNNGIFSINLPRLKTLHLCLSDSHRPLMCTLFNSCPLLERLHLRISLEESGHCLDIVAPNLKHLRLVMGIESLKECNILINAPMLEKFETNCAGLFFIHFAKESRALQEARVELCQYLEGEEKYVSQLLALMQGICCVRYLDFTYYGQYLSEFFNDMCVSTFFHNLTHFRFTCEPVVPMTRLPRSLLRNLKTLEITLLETGEYEIELLRKILIDATVLEELDIYVQSTQEDIFNFEELLIEFRVCIDIFKLPRSSSRCQIEFFGKLIRVLSLSVDHIRKLFNC